MRVALDVSHDLPNAGHIDERLGDRHVRLWFLGSIVPKEKNIIFPEFFFFSGLENQSI
jgi:hypothetical protein